MKKNEMIMIKSSPYRFLTLVIYSAFLLSYILVTNACSSFYWGMALDGYPITKERLDQIESETRLCPQIVVFYLQWPSFSSPQNDFQFSMETLNALSQRGIIPCITWEPMYYEQGKEIMIQYEQILNGHYDRYIRFFADQAKSFGKPFMIRFAHEMNIERYHWGTSKDHYGKISPDIYKQMFQYVVTCFKHAGTDQVLWAFCPNSESLPNAAYNNTASWNRIDSYYPGDQFVDILGIDGYNWGTTQTLEKHGWQSNWRSFKEVFSSAYEELKKIAPHKPMFIFETASAEQGGSKSDWITEAFSVHKDWDIQGVIWFQVNKEIDWRINSTGNTSYVPVIRSNTSALGY